MDLTEHWAPIRGYEGAYEVSSLGRVRSLPGGKRRGKVLKPGKVCGYPTYGLSAGVGQKRRYRVYLLVAAAFIGPRPDGLEVCHNNGDKSDNRAVNLRYDTRNANGRDALIHGQYRWVGKTHCIQGHEFTEANTYLRVTLSSDGHEKHHRSCRTCRKENHRRESLARRAAA